MKWNNLSSALGQFPRWLILYYLNMVSNKPKSEYVWFRMCSINSMERQAIHALLIIDFFNKFQEWLDTIIKEGLSEQQASLLCEIAQTIEGGCNLELRDSTPAWRITKTHERLVAILEQYASLFTEPQMAEFKNDVGAIMDYISQQMIGYSYDQNIDFRILMGYKAEYIPQDIVIEDVTAHFAKINKNKQN